jgi:hypothetical protein
MPRAAVEANERMKLRVAARQKATLMRAAAPVHADLMESVTRAPYARPRRSSIAPGG